MRKTEHSNRQRLNDAAGADSGCCSTGAIVAHSLLVNSSPWDVEMTNYVAACGSCMLSTVGVQRFAEPTAWSRLCTYCFPCESIIGLNK